MITLSKGGAYLLNGLEIIEDSQDAVAAIKSKTGITTDSKEALKNTIA